MARAPEERIVRCGVASRARPGEDATGDRYVIKHHGDEVVIAVIDGLGHGREAARAAEMAVEVISSIPTDDLIEIVNETHRQLQGSRGVVMTVISLNPARNLLSCLAIGNVHGMLVRRNPHQDEADRDFYVLRGGVVGHVLPPLRTTTMDVAIGDTMVLATDGIRIDFISDKRIADSPQALADHLLASYAIDSDDALVLTARYIGIEKP